MRNGAFGTHASVLAGVLWTACCVVLLGAAPPAAAIIHDSSNIICEGILENCGCGKPTMQRVTCSASHAEGLQEQGGTECDDGYSDCKYEETSPIPYHWQDYFEVPADKRLYVRGYLTSSCEAGDGCVGHVCVERFCPFDGWDWLPPEVLRCE